MSGEDNEPKEYREFLVELSGSKYIKVRCPLSSRVTFGPFAGTRGLSTLRIYEGSNKDNQFGVIVGVQAFYDLDKISIEDVPIQYAQAKGLGRRGDVYEEEEPPTYHITR